MRWPVVVALLTGCFSAEPKQGGHDARSVTTVAVPALAPIHEDVDHRYLMTWSVQLPGRVCQDQDWDHFMMWSGPYRDAAPFFWGWPIEQELYVADVEVRPADDSTLPVHCLVRCSGGDGVSGIEIYVAEGFSGQARCALSAQDDLVINVVEGERAPSASVHSGGLVALDARCQRFYGPDRCQQWQLTTPEDHWTRREPDSLPVAASRSSP
jgi:hypothetical protein